MTEVVPRAFLYLLPRSREHHATRDIVTAPARSTDIGESQPRDGIPIPTQVQHRGRDDPLA